MFEVLGLDAVVVEQPSRPEADHVAAQIADRPEQPAVEPVDRAAPTFLGQPGLHQLVDGEPGGQQVFGQGVPAGRGVAAAERGRRDGVEAAGGEELHGRGGLRGAQLGGVELGGVAVGLQQPATGVALALHRGAAALVGQPVPDPGGQPFHRLREPDDLDSHHERDRVAARAAAEAVEGADRRAHIHRRGLLVVERAQPLQRARPGPAQRHVLADDLVDPDAVTDLGDVALPDPTRHRSKSRRCRQAGAAVDRARVGAGR